MVKYILFAVNYFLSFFSCYPHHQLEERRDTYTFRLSLQKIKLHEFSYFVLLADQVGFYHSKNTQQFLPRYLSQLMA